MALTLPPVILPVTVSNPEVSKLPPVILPVVLAVAAVIALVIAKLPPVILPAESAVTAPVLIFKLPAVKFPV